MLLLNIRLKLIDKKKY